MASFQTGASRQNRAPHSPLTGCQVCRMAEAGTSLAAALDALGPVATNG